jgi:hypothetical protein
VNEYQRPPYYFIHLLPPLYIYSLFCHARPVPGA